MENKKMEKWRVVGITSLIIVISGIIGWVYEFIFYYFDQGMNQFYMQGGNFLPWINIYAIGACIIMLLTYKHKDKPFLVFLLSFLSTGLLEFFSGFILYKLFGVRYWDYNIEILNFGNIGGFICLRSVLLFGISGLFLIYKILPFCTKLSYKLNKKKFLIISVGICSLFLLDELYNLIIANIFNLPSAIDIYKTIGFKYM